MIEKIGHIKNPLSVIAIFAAIAEISGTTVLPFIAENNQSIYIWFLMFFPIFLVGTFFLTLNFNHRVLYAPSHYKDEKNFLSSISRARPDEQSKKLHDEVEEVEADESYEHASIAKTSTEPTNIVIRNKKREIMADVTLAEKLAINSLAGNLGLDFKTDIKFSISESRKKSEASTIKVSTKTSVIFDAAHISENTIHAAEVKLFKTKEIDPSRFSAVIRMSELIANQCTEASSKEFTLHIFAVMDTLDADLASLKNTLIKFATSSEINIIVHVATLNDLQNEYQYNT